MNTPATRSNPARTAVGAIVLALAVLMGACSAEPTPTDGNASADHGNPSSESDADVVVADMQFSPETIEIDTGDTVVWTFDGGRTQHDVVGDGWGSETQDSGTFAHTFDEAGTYPYECTLHPGMTGAVVVTD